MHDVIVFSFDFKAVVLQKKVPSLCRLTEQLHKNLDLFGEELYRRASLWRGRELF